MKINVYMYNRPVVVINNIATHECSNDVFKCYDKDDRLMFWADASCIVYMTLEYDAGQV